MATERPGQPIPPPGNHTQGDGSNPGRPGDDRELLHRLRRGDEAALSQLYDRYSGVVLALLLRIVGSRAEAEDLLQEVFLQVWRRAPEYDPQRASFSTWIFTIARNRALDVVRSPRHKNHMAERSSEAQGTSGSGPGAARSIEDTLKAAEEQTPEESVALKQRAVLVHRALSELTLVQREAMELAYYGGLSHSEIATQTGEPLGTVKSRINQAAARLRSALAQLGGRT